MRLEGYGSVNQSAEGAFGVFSEGGGESSLKGEGRGTASAK